MTRAKDALYLSHYQHGRKNEVPSAFFREVAGSELTDCAMRLPLPAPQDPPESRDGGGAVQLTLTFSDLALYEECPRRYHLAVAVGFTPPATPGQGYGRAVHHILHNLADAAVRGQHLDPTTVTQIIRAGFYLPLATRELYLRLRARAERQIAQYLDQHGTELRQVWASERALVLTFRTSAGQISVKGRADLILKMSDGGLSLCDFKTARGASARAALQLGVYAAAASAEGLDVRAAYVHQLYDGKRQRVPVDTAAVKRAVDRVEATAEGILRREFAPKPAEHCRACPQRLLCPDAR